MTETTDTATAVDSTGDEPPIGDTAPPEAHVSELHTPEADTNTHEPDEQQNSNREAAKYRTERNALKAERDQLTERLTVLQRAEVERLAGAKLADGKDVWRDGAELTNVLDDDGNIDPGKVDDVIAGLLSAHSHWRKLGPSAPPASTVTANDKITGDTRPSFVDAFAPRKG